MATSERLLVWLVLGTGCGRVGFDATVECAFTRPLVVRADADALGDDYSVAVTFDHASMVAARTSLASGDDLHVLYDHRSIDRVLDAESAWNSATTRVWFRVQTAVDSRSSDDGYELCYGAPTRQPPADGDRVFLLWDDFAGATIDPDKWSVVTKPTVTVTSDGGVLSVAGASTVETQFDVFGIEARQRFRDDVMAECMFGIRSQSDDSQQNWKTTVGLHDDYIGLLHVNSESNADKRIQYFVDPAWADVADSTFDATTFSPQRLGQTLSSTGLVQHLENGTVRASRTGIPAATRQISFAFGPDKTGGGALFDVQFDDVVVRRYVASDPAIRIDVGAERRP